MLGLNACLLNSMEDCHFLLQSCDFLCCSLHHPLSFQINYQCDSPQHGPRKPSFSSFSSLLIFSSSLLLQKLLWAFLISVTAHIRIPLAFLCLITKFSKTWVSFHQDGPLHFMSCEQGERLRNYSLKDKYPQLSVSESHLDHCGILLRFV